MVDRSSALSDELSHLKALLVGDMAVGKFISFCILLATSLPSFLLCVRSL
jgi:hypothetical protein